jgi:lysophospholipase L1-like esterase
MRYVALGDSISIDLYTEVVGGGAASQLARLLQVSEFENRTFDGATTVGVLERDFSGAPLHADVVTLTIGGNDLLGGGFARAVGDRAQGQVMLAELFANLEQIGALLSRVSGKVVFNSIYDPTDGDDSRAVELGLTPEVRPVLAMVNARLREVAQRHGYLFCDLEALFRGHGFWSKDPWIVFHIEPNLAGATAIAKAWQALLK